MWNDHQPVGAGPLVSSSGGLVCVGREGRSGLVESWGGIVSRCIGRIVGLYPCLFWIREVRDVIFYLLSKLELIWR